MKWELWSNRNIFGQKSFRIVRFDKDSEKATAFLAVERYRTTKYNLVKFGWKKEK